MRKIAVPLLAATLGAFAADRAAASPVDQWTGFYLGANAGHAWGRSDASTAVTDPGTYFPTTDPAQIAAAGAGRIDPRGFTGGGQAGYNWQNGSVVYGIEADFQAFALDDSRATTVEFLSSPGIFFTLRQSVKTNWLFTARPRLGWATGNTLFYVTGGVAVTELKYDGIYTDTGFSGFQDGSVSKLKAGWTAGGGAEYRWTEHWSAKVEYLYVRFDEVSSAGAVSNTGGFRAALGHSADLAAHVVRFGVNYRFGRR